MAKLLETTAINTMNLENRFVHSARAGCPPKEADMIRALCEVCAADYDGVTALFGMPVAHEDHVQRVCYAALSI